MFWIRVFMLYWTFWVGCRNGDFNPSFTPAYNPLKRAACESLSCLPPV